MTVAWIVGRRGLLGSAIDREVLSRHDWATIPAEPLPWIDDALLATAAAQSARLMIAESKRRGEAWSIVWAAGTGVTSTPESEFDKQLAQLTVVLDSIAGVIADAGPGSIFFASSAGGVYAGSESPPFTEDSVPVPLAPYGRFKLAAEARVTEFARTHGMSSLVGRIANLYGPGQRLEKLQGIISQLARAQYSSTPATIFVPLDTARDYIHADDCAGVILDALDHLSRVSSSAESTHVTKIIASGQAITIGTLLRHFRAVTKSAPHVVLGRSDEAAFQALDLRLRSVVWTHLDARSYVPIPAGIRSTIDGILLRLQAATVPQASTGGK